ncbi:MAG TPA: alpha/beta hydrolase [Acidimicrobiales bacterium]|nr:alpha/beta hydrolase [Acidimicrobiales bacterium]
MSGWSFIERETVRLACRDFGGHGPSVLLLHGLAGHAGEWTQTAQWLTSRCHVVAFDARGHGRSERAPVDVSRAAHVADTVFVVEELGLAPVLLIGQSLGGLTALLVAARHPDLVRGLVVADASPEGEEGANVVRVGQALGNWPVPFPSRDAAVEFFGGPSLRAEAWADGLEDRGDGLWPCFDVEVMVRTLQDVVGHSYWAEWDRIRCTTLVARAGDGVLPDTDARSMIDRNPQARLIEFPHSGHDLHLDCPADWEVAVSQFLDSSPVQG